MAIPMLFVLATSTRALRGAAWLVAPGLMVLGLAVAVWWPILVYLRYGAPFDRFAWTLLAIGIGLPVLLVAYGWTIVRVYQAKWASDQTLLILQWWFVTALWWTMLLGTQGELAALLGLAPYALLVLLLFVIALLRRRRCRPPRTAPAPSDLRRPRKEFPTAARPHATVALDRERGADHRARFGE